MKSMKTMKKQKNMKTPETIKEIKGHETNKSRNTRKINEKTCRNVSHYKEFLGTIFENMNCIVEIE